MLENMTTDQELVMFIKLRLTEYHGVTILSDMLGPMALYAIDGEKTAIAARRVMIPQRDENENNRSYSARVVDEIMKHQPKYLAFYCFGDEGAFRAGIIPKTDPRFGDGAGH